MAEGGKKMITVSEEEINFLRFANLVIRICPKAVRVVFDKCFQPCGLGSVLKTIKPKIEALCKKRIINKSQMDILYPAKGTSQVKSTEFDTTLMFCLLRNIHNLRFPVELPKPEESTIENDLSRINYYRNFIAHHATGELSNKEFMKAWKTLTEAVERLGGTDLKSECDHLCSVKLDSSFRESFKSWILDELNVVKQRIEDLETKRDHYKDNLFHDFDEWVEKEKYFYMTSAVANIEQKVTDNSFVLICGASGMGKSASAYHIALKWKEEQNYEIVSVIEPRDILTYASAETNQIFIIDDFCGKFVTDDQQCEAWKRLSNRLRVMFRKHGKSTRVVGICRSNIACTKQVRNLIDLLSIEVCDLLDDTFSVSVTEKRKIALQYFDEESLNKIDNDVIKKEYMFPLLCSLSVKTVFDPGLFNTPYDKYKEEFTKILTENETCFFGLVLLVLSNNKLDSNELSATPSFAFIEVFDKVWEDTDLDFAHEKPRKISVLQQLRSIIGIFTRENGNIISALHDKIFDFLAYFVFNKAPMCILEHGHMQLIRERVSFDSQKDNDDTPFMLYIPVKHENVYFDRLFAKFKTLLFVPLFYNNLSNNSYYQNTLVNKMRTDKELHCIIVQNVWPLIISGLLANKHIHVFIANEIEEFSRLSNNNLNPYILEVLDNYDDEVRDMLLTVSDTEAMPLMLAVEFRQLYTFNLLLNASTRARDVKTLTIFLNDDDDDGVKEEDGYFWCPLIETLKIIEYDADASYFNLLHPHISSTDFEVPRYYSLLHWICRTCRIAETLAAPLNNLTIDINRRDPRGNTPLYIACEENNEIYVKLLVQHGCDVNISDIDGVTPLMVACGNKNEVIIDTLFSSGECNPNLTDKYGDTALCRTTQSNLVRIAHLLVIYGASVNTHNNTNQSPLHIAAMHCQNEMIQFLVENSCEINIVDGFGNTPLMLSCITGNEKIVQYLLKQECFLDKQDAEGQTALHKAVISNYYEIVQLLVKKNGCNIHICDEYGSTPLDYAIESGYSDIVSLLLLTGDDVGVRDSS